MLDEPTNHLDAESVAWLEHHIQQYEGTVIAVTHDRYFLDNVAGWILELDRGMESPGKATILHGSSRKKMRLAQEEKTESQRQKTLERELEWIRMSPKGRHAKGKARINSYEAAPEQGNRKAGAGSGDLYPAGAAVGTGRDRGAGSEESYGERLLFEDLNFRLPPGGIVGVIGPNGAGKTTLVPVDHGQENPDAGSIRLGETAKLAYVDQSRDVLDPEQEVWQEISDGLDNVQLGSREVASRAYVARFNFSGSDQQKKVGSLSGGERNRVHLAKC